MYNRNGIFDYYAGDSVIYRLSSVYRVISVLFVSIYIVIGSSIIDMLVINFYIMIMVIFSDISMGIYLNNLRVCRWFIVLVIILSLLISRSVVIGGLFGVKVIDFIMYLSLISMTSSFKDIVYGVEVLLRPIDRFMNVSKMAMNMGLFSKFVTILYNEDVRIRNAHELRGVMYREMGYLDKIRYFFSNIVPVWKSSMEKIRKIKMSMRVRNYGCFLRRSNYRLNKFGKTDTIMLGINVVVLVLIIIY